MRDPNNRETLTLLKKRISKDFRTKVVVGFAAVSMIAAVGYLALKNFRNRG